MIFPLAIAGVCALTSKIGTYFVRLGKNNNIMAALYRGFAVSAILSAVLLYFVTDYIVGLNNILIVEGTSTQFTGMSLFICGLLGLIITGFVLALEGFAGANIVYDLNGWYRY